MKHTVSQQAMLAEWEEVQAAQANPAAFAPLYHRYHEAIYRFVYQRTLDAELCSDLVSEIFIRAMQKIESYRFQGVPFSAWLYRIAANEVAQYYRRSQKRRVIALDDQGVEQLREEVAEQQGLHEKEQLELDWAQLQTLLQDLAIEDVQLIEMRFFEKRAFKEIAEILDLSESNAKVRLYRLLEKLRKAFVR